MIDVNFLGDQLYIARVEGRPWVPVEPICWRLGIDAIAQIKRMRRHHDRAGLELRALTYGDETHLGIPLEETHWFLRTLRPTDSAAKKRLDKYRGGLFWRLLWEWVEAYGSYLTKREVRDRMIRSSPSPKPTPPIRRTGITKSMAAKMKEMYQSDPSMSFSKVGAEFGYSAATVCQIINGKYPVALKEDSNEPSNPN